MPSEACVLTVKAQTYTDEVYEKGKRINPHHRQRANWLYPRISNITICHDLSQRPSTGKY